MNTTTLEKIKIHLKLFERDREYHHAINDGCYLAQCVGDSAFLIIKEDEQTGKDLYRIHQTVNETIVNSPNTDKAEKKKVFDLGKEQFVNLLERYIQSQPQN